MCCSHDNGIWRRQQHISSGRWGFRLSAPLDFLPFYSLSEKLLHHSYPNALSHPSCLPSTEVNVSDDDEPLDDGDVVTVSSEDDEDDDLHDLLKNIKLGMCVQTNGLLCPFSYYTDCNVLSFHLKINPVA